MSKSNFSLRRCAAGGGFRLGGDKGINYAVRCHRAKGRHDARLYARRGACAGYGVKARRLSSRGTPDQRPQRLYGGPARYRTAKVKNVSKAERGRFAAAKVEPKMKL